MTWHALVLFAPLVAMLCGAAAIDLRQRRIPNALTLAIALTGLLQSLTTYGTVTPRQAVLGFLAGGAISLLPFLIGARGGGDVKLIAGAGAWMGPGLVFELCLAAAVVGMLMVLVQAAVQGTLRVLLRNTAVVTINLAHIQDLGVEHVSRAGNACRSVRKPLPYAVPVLVAALALLLAGRGGLI